MLLVVAEPSVSGLSDMKRIIEVGQHFDVPIAVCVNKYDVNMAITSEIETYAKSNGCGFVGTIPFDKEIIQVTNKGITPIEYSIKATPYIKAVYNKTIHYLKENTHENCSS